MFCSSRKDLLSGRNEPAMDMVSCPKFVSAESERRHWKTRGNLSSVDCRISFLALHRFNASYAYVLEEHPARGVLKSPARLN